MMSDVGDSQDTKVYYDEDFQEDLLSILQDIKQNTSILGGSYTDGVDAGFINLPPVASFTGVTVRPKNDSNTTGWLGFNALASGTTYNYVVYDVSDYDSLVFNYSVTNNGYAPKICLTNIAPAEFQQKVIIEEKRTTQLQGWGQNFTNTTVNDYTCDCSDYDYLYVCVGGATEYSLTVTVESTLSVLQGLTITYQENMIALTTSLVFCTSLLVGLVTFVICSIGFKEKK